MARSFRPAAPAHGSLIACAGLAAALAGCPPPPPEPPAIVVVPVAATAGAPPAAEEPPPALLDCPAGMVLLKGGQFEPLNKPVRVADYCLDRHEVTAEDYEACVQSGACDDEELACDDASTYKKPELGGHPINCVSWQQASRYCKAGGNRLPTWEEWEWAAQSGSEHRRFPWGEEEPEGQHMCWSKGQGRTGTCKAGAFPLARTPQGVDDLFGNVWEWLAPEIRNGIPNVSRGSSWNNDWPSTVEGENPGGFIQGFVRNDVVGFRCARAR